MEPAAPDTGAERVLAGLERLLQVRRDAFDLDQYRLHPACGQLVERLNAAGKAGDFELAVANRLWGQSDHKILPDLPYKGNELSMIVLLSRAVDGRKALEEKLTVENLKQWTGAMSRKQGDVQLPRFQSTEQFELSKTLSELGMKDAFSEEANFSGMTGNRDLFISAVIHKAFVDVNEKGTEAAAATAVVMELAFASPKEPPVKFKADHPFVFLIRDNQSGAILFLGRVMNPASLPYPDTTCRYPA